MEAWNDAQPADKKLDLVREPEPPPRDTEKEALTALLAKADGDVTAAELKQITLRLARRVLARGI